MGEIYTSLFKFMHYQNFTDVIFFFSLLFAIPQNLLQHLHTASWKQGIPHPTFPFLPVPRFQGPHSQIQIPGDSELGNHKCLEIRFSINFLLKLLQLSLL